MKPALKEINSMLATSKIAAKKAGNYLKKNFRQHGPAKYSYKEHREIVTSQDKRANEIIVKIIRKKFPAHNIISEEKKYKKTNSGYTWYIDPLDGTTNYTAGIPLYAVNIGLACENEPIAGVIFLPDKNELYWAIKNRGAYFNNKKIRVSKTNKINNAFIQLCHAYKQEERLTGAKIVKRLTNKVRVYRRFGCAGVEHSNVAAGRTDAIIIAGSRSWDNLAGAVIIREAGGRATDRSGKPWLPDSKDFIATNGKIHNQLLKIIK